MSVSLRVFQPNPVGIFLFSTLLVSWRWETISSQVVWAAGDNIHTLVYSTESVRPSIFLLSVAASAESMRRRLELPVDRWICIGRGRPDRNHIERQPLGGAHHSTSIRREILVLVHSIVFGLCISVEWRTLHVAYWFEVDLWNTSTHQR